VTAGDPRWSASAPACCWRARPPARMQRPKPRHPARPSATAVRPRAGSARTRLHEFLGAFQLRGGCRGPKRAHAGCRQCICQAVHQGRLRPDHDHADAVVLAELDHLGDGRAGRGAWVWVWPVWGCVLWGGGGGGGGYAARSQGGPCRQGVDWQLPGALTAALLATSRPTFDTPASWPMPGLPGAQYSASHSGDCASFHARACSRPPAPTTSTFCCKEQAQCRHMGVVTLGPAALGGAEHAVVPPGVGAACNAFQQSAVATGLRVGGPRLPCCRLPGPRSAACWHCPCDARPLHANGAPFGGR
jgi:hypothetical protein